MITRKSKRRNTKGWRLPFRRSEGGGVIMEFAFALPILTVLILGTVNTAMYILLHQRLDRAATTVADLVSQPAAITQSDVHLSFDAAKHLFGSLFDLDANGHIIVTSILGTADGPEIQFQFHKDCNASVHASSVGGEIDGPATLPGSMTVLQGESVIVSEVFFDYEPLFFSELIEGGTQYRQSFRRPRLGAGAISGGTNCVPPT